MFRKAANRPRLLRAWPVALFLCAPQLLGCGSAAVPATKAAARPVPKVSRPGTKSAPASAVKTSPPALPQQELATPPVNPPAEPVALQPPAANPPRSTLTDLVRQAEVGEFKLPEINDAKAQTAGIRKLTGKHITIYTDLPSSPEVDELPEVFDLAVPQWASYFELDPAGLAQWKTVGYLMKEKERFSGAGLLPESLPEFLHGFTRGSEFWWYDQPSAFYRRQLMLHEGTHAFMFRHLHGAGPPWYLEGTAEFLGTHRWEGGKLTLGYNPRTREEAPLWGRVKIIRDEYAASRGMLLTDIMKYDARAHLKNEPYGWCWGAVLFLDSHPLTQKAFRELRTSAPDRSIDFSRHFLEQLKGDWPAISEDWQLFVVNLDYGYDVARAAIVRQAEVKPLPAEGAKVSVAADRGWQSTGLKLEAGNTYRITASGRYQVAKEPMPWPCEPGGITIHYHQGKPLGMLLAAVGDTEIPAGAITPLAKPTPIGILGEMTPTTSGTLYLCINEAASGLADNSGNALVKVTLKGK